MKPQKYTYLHTQSNLHYTTGSTTPCCYNQYGVSSDCKQVTHILTHSLTHTHTHTQRHTPSHAIYTRTHNLVMNCQVNVDTVPLDDLPVVSPSPTSPVTSMSDVAMSAPLSEEEIVIAISELRSGKAPGLDGISLEMFRLGGGETTRWLKSLFNTIWATESVPKDWQSQLLVPLHKKGSRTTCDNYRGIALLSIPGKVFAKAILNRLKPRAEQLLHKGQCGFRRG